MEDKKRGGIIITTRKEVAGFSQYVVVKKNIWIQFKDRKLKDMSTGSLMLILAEEEVVKGGEDNIYNPPKKLKVYCWLLMGTLLLNKVA